MFSLIQRKRHGDEFSIALQRKECENKSSVHAVVTF